MNENENEELTVLDTIITQAIICVMIGIGFLLLNMFQPSVSQEIYYLYDKNVKTEGMTLTEFIRTTPHSIDD